MKSLGSVLRAFCDAIRNRSRDLGCFARRSERALAILTKRISDSTHAQRPIPSKATGPGAGIGRKGGSRKGRFVRVGIERAMDGTLFQGPEISGEVEVDRATSPRGARALRRGRYRGQITMSPHAKERERRLEAGGCSYPWNV